MLEQSSTLTEIGSGVGMHGNAMRVLTALGAADFVRDSGVRIDSGEWRRMDDGSLIFTQHFTAMAGHYGDVYICMHRADLLESLVRRVPPERFRLNAKLVGLRERPGGVVATLADGDEIAGDVLVGADGLRSTVRTVLFGEQPARFTGFAGWRGVIPADAMPPGFEHRIVTWPGRGRHCMTYPIRPDLVTFNGFVPSAEIHREEWGPSGDLNDLRRSFEVGSAEGPLPEPAATAQVLRRPEAERAAGLWRGGLALEDRSRLWVGEREGYARFLRRACPEARGRGDPGARLPSGAG